MSSKAAADGHLLELVGALQQAGDAFQQVVAIIVVGGVIAVASSHLFSIAFDGLAVLEDAAMRIGSILSVGLLRPNAYRYAVCVTLIRVDVTVKHQFDGFPRQIAFVELEGVGLCLRLAILRLSPRVVHRTIEHTVLVVKRDFCYDLGGLALFCSLFL